MYTNTDMTLYSGDSKNGYTRKVIKGVLWLEVKQALIEKTGMTSPDSVKIYIPAENIPSGVKFNAGKDLVVKGEISTEFDNTSQQTISASLTALKAVHDVYTVTVADDKLYGSSMMQHYQLSCK